jgi:hypothetical protein
MEHARRRMQPGPESRTAKPRVWRTGGLVRLPLVPASEEQRAKVAELSCVVCGRSPVDPAHLVPRKHGGCNDAECVVPLCRTHHRLYDHAQLVLGAYLAGGWRRERAHALTHVSARRLRRALRGRGW